MHLLLPMSSPQSSVRTILYYKSVAFAAAEMTLESVASALLVGQGNNCFSGNYSASTLLNSCMCLP